MLYKVITLRNETIWEKYKFPVRLTKRGLTSAKPLHLLRYRVCGTVLSATRHPCEPVRLDSVAALSLLPDSPTYLLMAVSSVLTRQLFVLPHSDVIEVWGVIVTWSPLKDKANIIFWETDDVALHALLAPPLTKQPGVKLIDFQLTYLKARD